MPLYMTTLLVTGPQEEVLEAAARHREHLRELRQSGKLRMAGEFGSGEGFLEILDVTDLHEAEKVARSSPLIAAGLGAWVLREWVETIGSQG